MKSGKKDLDSYTIKGTNKVVRSFASFVNSGEARGGISGSFGLGFKEQKGTWLISTACTQLLGRPHELNEQGRALEIAIEATTLACIDLKDSLNEWDNKVGDDDRRSIAFFWHKVGS
ncbi:hypothetical protein Hdeb2414_s0003g00091261 [Helianthus debilis subsp. tardiflorus]